MKGDKMAFLEGVDFRMGLGLNDIWENKCKDIDWEGAWPIQELTSGWMRRAFTISASP